MGVIFVILANIITVIPAKAGIQGFPTLKTLDPGLRRGDEKTKR